jgi:hypothetical protein
MSGRMLRIIAIVLLGVTATITLLSGIGTSCVALDATRYEGMERLSQYQWLYVLYVAAGVIVGATGIRATIALIRGRRGAYRLALVALLLGLLSGGLHMATSRALRGSSMPTDFVVYATIITLAVFAVLRIPAIWNRVSRAGDDGGTAGLGSGIAMIVASISLLTVQWWAGASHSIGGVNYADAWRPLLATLGWLLLLGGSGMIARTLAAVAPRPLSPVREVRAEEGLSRS